MVTGTMGLWLVLQVLLLMTSPTSYSVIAEHIALLKSRRLQDNYLPPHVSYTWNAMCEYHLFQVANTVFFLPVYSYLFGLMVFITVRRYHLPRT